MPELPEVETIVNNLRPALSGRTITAVNLLWARTLAVPTPPEFQARLPGQTIRQLGRRGKHVLLYLITDTLIIHLRMSGDLLIEADGQPQSEHCRLALSLDNGQRLAFNDARKFGRVWLTANPAEVLARLGPEPLDEAFTPQMFYRLLQARRRQLKPLLLDQTFIAGLGNIYADESLHRAQLHPLTLAHTLSAAQAEALWRAIRQTLQEGIRRNGASIDWVYRHGDFQNHFRVYQRSGQPCPACGAPIVRILVGQRGTHFCPVCQPLPLEV